MRVFGSAGTAAPAPSVVVVAATDVLVRHGERGGRGVARAGDAIETALEDRVHVAVGAGAGGQRPGTRRLEPRGIVTFGEPEDAQAGAVALLGMGPVGQDGRHQGRRLRADGRRPVDEAGGAPARVRLMRPGHVLGERRVAAALAATAGRGDTLSPGGELD